MAEGRKTLANSFRSHDSQSRATFDILRPCRPHWITTLIPWKRALLCGASERTSYSIRQPQTPIPVVWRRLWQPDCAVWNCKPVARNSARQKLCPKKRMTANYSVRGSRRLHEISLNSQG